MITFSEDAYVPSTVPVAVLGAACWFYEIINAFYDDAYISPHSHNVCTFKAFSICAARLSFNQVLITTICTVSAENVRSQWNTINIVTIICMRGMKREHFCF